MQSRFVIVGLALVLTACTETQPAPKSAASIRSAPAPSSCPLGVDGARVIYEDVPEGGQLTFTAPLEQLGALRQRAYDAAAMHGPGERLGAGHDGAHGNGGNHGLRAMQMPPARAHAEDFEGGARITVRASFGPDLAELRLKLRQRATEMMVSCSA